MDTHDQCKISRIVTKSFCTMREKIFFQAKTTLHGNVNRDRKCQNKEGQKKLHSFFDSKKKMKVPKENASKRTESNKTKALKRKKLMKMYQQVRKIKIT